MKKKNNRNRKKGNIPYSNKPKQRNFLSNSNDNYQTQKKYYEEGEEHYGYGRFDEAIQSYTKLIEILQKLMIGDYCQFSNKCAVAYDNRGKAHNDKREFDLAIEDYNSALKLDSNYFQAYGNRGIAYKNKDEFDLAIEDFNKVLDIDQNNVITYLAIGETLCIMEKYEEAIEYFNRSIVCILNLIRSESYPSCENENNKKNLSMSYKFKCASLIKLTEYKEAVVCSNFAIEMNDKDASIYYNKGLALAHLKRYEEAIECFDLAIDLKPNYVNANYNKSVTIDYKGSMLTGCGKYEDAIKCHDSAIALDPNNSIFYNNKSYALIKIAEDEERKKNYGEWTAKVNENYQKWIEVCCVNKVVDYTTSMNIYLSHNLLLKQENKDKIKKADELTSKYIKSIVEFEQEKNQEKIKEYFEIKNENKIQFIRDDNCTIILYQYCAYNKYIIDNIKNKQIYFSDPSTFNDPFDPLIRILDKEHSEKLMKLLKFRVSCLSSRIDNLLLWSHYADKHKGLCIAYDITRLVKQNNIIFRKVKYLDSYPKPQNGLIFTLLQNKNNKLDSKLNLTKTFTQKQITWNYEDEYRLILQTDIDKEFLQKVDIKEIYLGLDMDIENKESIKTIVKEMNLDKGENNIQVYSMNISNDNIFELVAK